MPRARLAAFLLPLALLLAVTLTHLGSRSGYYRMSRPDGGANGRLFFLPGDGFVASYDGVPVLADAQWTTRLARVFHGDAPELATGSSDERPFPAFLNALCLDAWLGSYAACVLLNVLFMGAACACAVDLVLRLRGEPLAATLFGSLVAVHRGVGFYVGTPDVHMMAFAWFPIAAWLFESLELASPTAPRTNAALFGLVLGLAAITYLGDLTLVGFLWVYGFRRAPWQALVIATVVAGLVLVSWHVVGRAIGLAFEAHVLRSVGDGVRLLFKFLGDEVSLAVSVSPNSPRDVPLASLRGHANSILVAIENLNGSPLTNAIVPCFGLPLIGLALAGLACASAQERRLGLAVAVPAIVGAWPINSYYCPRMTLPATTGLALLAAFALASLARWTNALVGRAASPRLAALVGGATAVALVLAFAALENADVFGHVRSPLGE